MCVKFTRFLSTCRFFVGRIFDLLHFEENIHCFSWMSNNYINKFSGQKKSEFFSSFLLFFFLFFSAGIGLCLFFCFFLFFFLIFIPNFTVIPTDSKSQNPFSISYLLTIVCAYNSRIQSSAQEVIRFILNLPISYSFYFCSFPSHLVQHGGLNHKGILH